jgi:hypothetical protein
MAITANDLRQLDDVARGMASRNHKTVLADALRCLHDDEDDPIAPLALLHAMWGAGHGKRSHPKQAIEDVGAWLEQRLNRTPLIAAQDLARELGWLQRLVAIHDRVAGGASSEPDDSHRGDGGRRDGGARHAGPPFGQSIAQLRKRRETLRDGTVVDLFARPPRTPEHTPPRAVVAAVTVLPDVLEVRFQDPKGALDAFRKARERAKAKRSPKHRLLAIEPVAPDVRPLATQLACCTNQTAGMSELQAKTLDSDGVIPAFWIAAADLEDRDGKRIPRRILFAPPATTADDTAGTASGSPQAPS